MKKKFLDWSGLTKYDTLIKDYIDSFIQSINTLLNNKVDKASGKGLSTNDYTTAEKDKLKGIASGAQVNQNAFSNVVVGSTTVAASTSTDTLTLIAGSNIILTPNDTNDSVTIQSKDTTYETATPSVLGLTKLYTNTGANTDGAMTQSAITSALNNKAPIDHIHTKSQITDFPTTLANPNSVIIKLNGGENEDINMFTYTGSVAKTINITPSSIGAAEVSHGDHVIYYNDTPKSNGEASSGSSSGLSRGDHVHPLQTNVSGNAGTATKLLNTRMIGNASFDGSQDISLSEMGIINPIEVTKAEYNALKASGDLDMALYYNVIDDYDSITLIDDITPADNQTFSSLKIESTFAKKSTVVDTVLNTAEWSGTSAPYLYILSVTGVTSTNINEINYNISSTDEQIEAYQNALLKDGGQSEGQIILLASGDKPTIDIPITIIVRHDI